MKIWKVILATFVIFAAGVLTGAVLNRLRERPPQLPPPLREPPGKNSPLTVTNRDPHLANPFGRPPFRNLGKEFLERLDREVKLEGDQRKRIEKLLDESQKRSKELWKKIEPEMREEMKKSRELMREVLSPDQNKKLDELMKRTGKPPKEGQSTNGLPVPPPAELSSNLPPPPPSEPPAKP